MTDRTRGWAAVALWAAIQLTLTSLPGRDIPVSIKHPVDWIGHAGLYFGLGFLLARVAVLRGWALRTVVVVGVLVSVAGALDELHQLFIPGRDAEVGDWLSDSVGGAAGLVVGFRLVASRYGAWLR